MDVAIAGGHGRIALRLAPLLVERGDRVRALIRNPDHAAEVRAGGAEPVICDLEGADEKQIAAAISGADAVVFAAGAGPGSGPERKFTVDHGAAVKLIAAAKLAGVPRYEMISAISADPEHPGDAVFDVYIRAKGQADAELAASGLRHTIIRPGKLTDGEPTGRVTLGLSVPYGEITRADVAALVAASLHSDAGEDRNFAVVNGPQPIAEALGAG